MASSPSSAMPSGYRPRRGLFATIADRFVGVLTAIVDTISELGGLVIEWVSSLGEVVLFSVRTMGWLFTRIPPTETLLPNFYQIGVLSLPMMLRSNLGKLVENFYVAQLLEKIDFNVNFGQWFARGLIDTSQIWYYLGGTLFFLFCTVLSLAARRVA